MLWTAVIECFQQQQQKKSKNKNLNESCIVYMMCGAQRSTKDCVCVCFTKLKQNKNTATTNDNRLLSFLFCFYLLHNNITNKQTNKLMFSKCSSTNEVIYQIFTQKSNGKKISNRMHTIIINQRLPEITWSKQKSLFIS